MTTITDFVKYLTPETINIRGTPYKKATIESYKNIVKNAFISQNIDINTIDWDNTETTSKLIDAITPVSYIPKLLGIICVYRPELIYYSSMVEQFREKSKAKGRNVFSQNLDGLSERIKKIEPSEYRLLFEI